LTRAFLSLGSNLGDRLEYLRAAVRALDRGPSTRVRGASKVYETVPVEVEGEQSDYLNCAVEVECGISAIELLRYCQGVEAALGRGRKGERAPRTVDIDLLLFGDEVFESADLLLPHRGIGRAFNLRCLADLDPDLYIPGRGSSASLLASADLTGVRELGEDV
jgi:2-amino-4-hydroxy-6-hydroxymethyldihydropteridine diphosphokinase